MLVEETYPSGRKVKNTFQTDGDLAKIETLAAGGSYATRADNFNYAAHGAIKHLQIGNGLWESAQFNNRLQVTQLGLGTSATDTSQWKLDYDFGTTDNNGNIKAQTVTSPVGTYAQSFTYDSLDRLKTAQETSSGNQTWTQSFTYDRYGNRTGFSQTLNGNTTNTTPTIDSNTNRFNLGQGYTYDAAGNVITDPQGRQFTFNGDNKQTEVKDSSNQTIGTYFYDGDGKRIKKVTSTENTTFVYSGGKLVAEYQLTNQTPTTATTQYLGTDMLGSPRVVSDQNGAVVSRRDFMPFGEDLARANYGTDSIRQKFTGYEKDTETGLDFAEARYYNSAHGRFTAVDPLLASGKSADPQTFNRYIYTMNNPLVMTDPSGMQVGNYVGPVYVRQQNNFTTFSNKQLKGFEIYNGDVRTINGTDGYRYKISSAGVVNLGKLSTNTNSTQINPIQQLVNSVARESIKKGTVVGGLATATTVGTAICVVACAPAASLVSIAAPPLIGATTFAAGVGAAKLIPVNGGINVGGIMETPDITNLNSEQFQEGANVPNLVSADAQNIGNIFEPNSADFITANRFPISGIRDWNQFSQGAYNVLRPGGTISMRITTNGGEITPVLEGLTNAGFQNVNAMPLGFPGGNSAWIYQIDAERPQ